MPDLTHTILIIEDDDDDVQALKRAFRKAKIENPMQVVATGREAVDYLQGVGKYADRRQYPLPFIIFLDLQLPVLDGFNVLTWIRHKPALDSVPVVVLTGLDSAKDHQKAYALGARSYLVKPPLVEDILQLIESMKALWRDYQGPGPVLNETN